MIRKLKIVHSKWLLISDGEALLVHMELRNTIYKGTAVGGYYNSESASNMLCLPPTWMRYSTKAVRQQSVYAVEYHTNGPIDHALYHNMPCSLCEATGRGDKIMIPSHYVCPDGWHKEYNGYIMALNEGHKGGSMYHCIDAKLEQIPGSGSTEFYAHYLYTVQATGTHIPGDGYPLSCIVCTK